MPCSAARSRRLLAVSSLLASVLAAGSAGAQASSKARPAAPAAAGFQDPALLRREILRRLDAQIDAAATKAHLEARLALDDAMPIPYLGIDADPADGGMKVTGVHGLSGAGLWTKSDSVTEFDDVRFEPLQAK